jgi:hypothetical protein
VLLALPAAIAATIDVVEKVRRLAAARKLRQWAEEQRKRGKQVYVEDPTGSSSRLDDMDPEAIVGVAVPPTERSPDTGGTV